MNRKRRNFLIRSVGFGAMAGFLGAGSLPALAESSDGTISATDAYKASQEGAVTLIDIRRPSEWSDTGIPQGAQAITMHDENGPASFLENIRKAVNGDQTAPIALICARGVRTRWAQRFLTANGFTNVLNVSEGMFGRGSKPGWLRRDLPVSTVTQN